MHTTRTLVLVWLLLVLLLSALTSLALPLRPDSQPHTINLPLVLDSYDSRVGVIPLSNTVLDGAARGVLTYETFVNAAAYQQDGIMSYGGYQYVAWYNDNLHARIARRALPDGAWQTIELDYQLMADDSHNTISLGVSPADGRIHVAFATHTAAVRYTRTGPGVATRPADHPWSADLFEPTLNKFPGATITPNFTYPRFERIGALLLLSWRNGSSGKGELEQLVYNNEGTWTNRGAFTSMAGIYTSNGGSSDERNAYLNGFSAASNGRLHISWVWREFDRSVACNEDAITNHDLGYAYSDDRGLTWRNSGGEIIGRTGTSNLIELNDDHIVAEISINSGLINQETQAIDSAGRFHAIVSHVPTEHWGVNECVDDFVTIREEYAYPYHYWRDNDGTWHEMQLPFPQGAVGRGKLLFDRHDTAYFVLPDLRIVAATAAMAWQDWRLVHAPDGLSIDGELIIDRQRVADEAVLSVIYQEANDHFLPSALRIADFKIGRRP